MFRAGRHCGKRVTGCRWRVYSRRQKPMEIPSPSFLYFHFLVVFTHLSPTVVFSTLNGISTNMTNALNTNKGFKHKGTRARPPTASVQPALSHGRLHTRDCALAVSLNGSLPRVARPFFLLYHILTIFFCNSITLKYNLYYINKRILQYEYTIYCFKN